MNRCLRRISDLIPRGPVKEGLEFVVNFGGNLSLRGGERPRNGAEKKKDSPIPVEIGRPSSPVFTRVVGTEEG